MSHMHYVITEKSRVSINDMVGVGNESLTFYNSSGSKGPPFGGVGGAADHGIPWQILLQVLGQPLCQVCQGRLMLTV